MSGKGGFRRSVSGPLPAAVEPVLNGRLRFERELLAEAGVRPTANRVDGAGAPVVDEQQHVAERDRTTTSERMADLCFNDWAGVRREPCYVVGETPKRYRIRVPKVTRLAGRDRWLIPGETALVPKTAVRLLPEQHGAS